VATARHFGLRVTESECEQVKGVWLCHAYRRLAPAHDAFVLRQHPSPMHSKTAVRGSRVSGGARRSQRSQDARDQRCGDDLARRVCRGVPGRDGVVSEIDCLVTQEEVQRPKPHPDALLRIMNLFGVAPDGPDAPLYLGDTAADIAAGKAAGVRTIGVTYGVSEEPEIRAAQPDHVIHSFAEMRRFLAGSSRRSCPSRIRRQAATGSWTRSRQ
jgi:beta-phosphoglucomutase-like phosphatase (HAD superfamily)